MKPLKDHKLYKDEGKWKKDDKGDSSKPKYSCFLCDGPHHAFKCPQRGKLMARDGGREER